LWLYREKLAKAGLIEELFERFDQHLTAKGYIARGGQIMPSSMPSRRNRVNDNRSRTWNSTCSSEQIVTCLQNQHPQQHDRIDLSVRILNKEKAAPRSALLELRCEVGEPLRREVDELGFKRLVEPSADQKPDRDEAGSDNELAGAADGEQSAPPLREGGARQGADQQQRHGSASPEAQHHRGDLPKVAPLIRFPAD